MDNFRNSSINISQLAKALASGIARRSHTSVMTQKGNDLGRVSTSELASAIAVRMSASRRSGASRIAPSASINAEDRLATQVASAIVQKMTPRDNSIRSFASGYSRQLSSARTQRVFSSHMTRKLASAVMRRLDKPPKGKADIVGLLASSIAERTTRVSSSETTGELPVNAEKVRPKK